MDENREAPVKAGEAYEVTVNAVGDKGDGIAKVKGFVLFIPNVKKGDFVKVKITKVLKNVGFAEVVEKLERQQRPQKFATVTQEEMNKDEEIEEKHYDDSEDFGGDLDEE